MTLLHTIQNNRECNCHRAALLLTRFHWIPPWTSNHMPSREWDEITYPFPNFNGCTVEVWEWIRNFISHLIMDVITYPWDVFNTCKETTKGNFLNMLHLAMNCILQNRYNFFQVLQWIRNFTQYLIRCVKTYSRDVINKCKETANGTVSKVTPRHKSYSARQKQVWCDTTKAHLLNIPG